MTNNNQNNFVPGELYKVKKVLLFYKGYESFKIFEKKGTTKISPVSYLTIDPSWILFCTNLIQKSSGRKIVFFLTSKGEIVWIVWDFYDFSNIDKFFEKLKP